MNSAAVDWLAKESAWALSDDAIIVASVFSSLSVIISMWHLYRHLRQYTMPQIQQWIVRILLICPIYAMSSAIALKLGPENGIYVEFIRDLYEAFVVYSLLNLIMEYCGGEVDCVYSIEHEGPLAMPFPFNFCMKARNRNAKLLRFTQKGVLQFVLIKPIMALCDVATMATGKYYDPVFQTVEAIIYNISYCTALYALLIIYLATRTMLKKFRCITKISTVKLIILTAYYQGLGVKLAPLSEEEAFAWKCVLLSVEMVFFSALLACAFPISEFMGGIPDRRVLANIGDLFAVRDIVEGFEHNFKPVYKDYALQRSQSEAPETVRMKTYLAGNIDNVAMEMTERYRGRSARFAFNNLLRGNKPIRAGLRNPKKGPTGPSPYTERRRRERMNITDDHSDSGDTDGSQTPLYGQSLEEGYGHENSVLVYNESGDYRVCNPVHQEENDINDNDDTVLRVVTSRGPTPELGAHASSENLLGGSSSESAPPKKVPLLAPPRKALPYVSPMSTIANSRSSDDLIDPIVMSNTAYARDDSADFGDFESGIDIYREEDTNKKDEDIEDTVL